jgi:hydrogenase/urease accessory protein HupE
MAKNDFIIYELEYPVATAAKQLRVEQDVLNEIEFAPGNPWEATYIVTMTQEARTLQEGLLLTRKEPVQLNCDWNTIVASSPPTLDKGRLFYQYIRHGIGHILTGYDHLLFVCALVLTAVTLMDLIKVISAFTLAHTITLILSVLNIVRLPSHIVEPMIAGSIVFVALTNVLWPKRSRGNVRIATAFFFGLFHGLGFAGGLLDAMDSMNGLFVGLAITAFSLGVEIGHQMVVLPVFFGLRFARTRASTETRRERLSLAMMQAGSLVITVVGAIYLIAALRS